MNAVSLMSLLESKNHYHKVEGLSLIRNQNSIAEPLLKKVLCCLFDPHPLVRETAAKVLSGTTNQEAILALYEGAHDPVLSVRIACLSAAPAISKSTVCN